MAINSNPTLTTKLKVLQWNCQELKHKKAWLYLALKEGEIDIALIQETLIKDSERLDVSGYNCFIKLADPQKHHRGLAILTKKNHKVSEIDNHINCGENVECMAVKVNASGQDLDIYNIYSSPNHGELELSELMQHASTHPTVLAGDMNAHHHLFNPPGITTVDAAGRHINAMLQEYQGVRLLNGPEPTHEKGAALDLTLTSTMLASGAEWRVQGHLISDHFATTTVINAHPVPTPPFVPRWNTRRADWPRYQQAVSAWAAAYEVPEDLDQHYDDVTSGLNGAAGASIPLTKPFLTHKSDAWFYNDRVKELKHRLNTTRKNYLQHKTETNLNLLLATRKIISQELHHIKN